MLMWLKRQLDVKFLGILSLLLALLALGQGLRILVLKNKVLKLEAAAAKTAQEHAQFVAAVRLNQDRANEIIKAADKTRASAVARIKEYESEPVPATPEAVRDWTLRILRKENP